MSETPLRFLLDQGFPKPTLNIESVDSRATFTHLSDWSPDLARVSTPDWLVVLEAGASGRFDGIVTRDLSSLSDPMGLVALLHTRLALITWKRSPEDPVTEWGQLVAFMSEIVKTLGHRPDVVIVLPKPTIRRDGKQVRFPHAMLGEAASKSGIAFAELRSQARREIDEELRARGREGLALGVDPPARTT